MLNKKTFFSTANIAALTVTTFLFITGCSNFLNTSEFKHEISNAIDYANAKDISLYIKADTSTGSFLNEGQISAKVGYSVEIQFTLNSNEYVFNKFVAVDSSAPEISKNNIVNFEITSTQEERNRGIYKAKITPVVYDANILIKADCTLIPKIIDAYPPFVPSGYDQDTTIQIKA